MKQNFTSQFFVDNRKRLKKSLSMSAPLVLAANGLLQRSGDTTYPFHQDASFWYFTGIDEPDVVLVCDKNEEYLIVPVRESSRAAVDGTIDELALSRISGIKQIFHQEEGWKKLSSALAKAKKVSTVAAAPEYIEQISLYTNPARRKLINKLKTKQSNLKLLDVGRDIARLRVIKQPVEIEVIQKAINITLSSLGEVLKPANLKKYQFEYEIEAELSHGFGKQGARYHAFEPIIAAGEHACIIHNFANDGSLKQNQLLLCDVGAEYDHYAADISRTVCVGTPSARQQAVYDAVLETQDYALSLLHPGTILKNYETEVEKFMGKKLLSLGLISVIDKKQIRKYMPHSVSHFLGLNVHDVGLYDQPLEAGMVVTAEPGIYILGETIGVRIEDDVLITENGNKVLSSKLGRSLN